MTEHNVHQRRADSKTLVPVPRQIVSESRHPTDVAPSWIGLAIEARDLVRRLEGLR